MASTGARDSRSWCVVTKPARRASARQAGQLGVRPGNRGWMRDDVGGEDFDEAALGVAPCPASRMEALFEQAEVLIVVADRAARDGATTGRALPYASEPQVRLPGHQKAFADLREMIAAKMTPQLLAEAQRLAREWMDAFERR